jgi:hypothetical protein
MLEERRILLCPQEIDLEVRKAMLAEEQVRGLHPLDGRDLSAELDRLCVHVDRVEVERATEARKLSQFVMEISNTLVDLGMLPVHNIPQLPTTAQEVLAAAGLILEHLQEAQASDDSPWD